MIERFDNIEYDPEEAARAVELLTTRGSIKIAVMLPNSDTITVLIVLDGDSLFIGGRKAGVWITKDTPANKFELIKGGFRIDIAERLMAILASLMVSKSVTQDVTVRLQLADLTNEGKEHG